MLFLGLALEVASAAPATNPPTTNLVEVLRNAIATPPKETAKETGGETNKVRVLTEGDVVQLQVYQEDDLGLPRATVTKDGTISHPLLGLIPIGGKTLEDAKQTILEMLKKDYLVDPRVSLTMVEFAKFKCTLLGQVNRPGTYEFASNVPLTLVQALSLAGSTTRIGSSKVKIQRTTDGVKKEIKLDLDKKEDKTFLILDGDMIEVAEKWI
jgi:polysaccharide biosynthesis/export protein VpsN